jgi:hypothetical protein
MMELEVRTLNMTQLKLIRFDFDMSQRELIEELFGSMTREEQVWAQKMSLTIPNISSEEFDKDVWDIVLVDNYLLDCIEYILNKYNTRYTVADISENYYHRDILIEELLSTSIDSYLDEYLTIDMVLDRINEIGINGINKFEKSFLERYNSI